MTALMVLKTNMLNEPKYSCFEQVNARQIGVTRIVTDLTATFVFSSLVPSLICFHIAVM